MTSTYKIFAGTGAPVFNRLYASEQSSAHNMNESRLTRINRTEYLRPRTPGKIITRKAD